MALSESIAAPSGHGGPPAAGPPGHHVRPSWRRWSLLALASLIAAAVVVLAFLAGTYQPVQFGDATDGAFPGLPTGTGLQEVNTFGNNQGQIYVPPQRGVFTISESIQNTGPRPVTIEAISMLSPTDQAYQVAGNAAWPLTSAGAVRWMAMYTGPHQPDPLGGNSVIGLSLRPGEDIYVGIPVRLSGSCYDKESFNTASVMYVKERFLTFTHWVAITFQIPYVFRQPANPGGEPAKDLTCLSK